MVRLFLHISIDRYDILYDGLPVGRACCCPEVEGGASGGLYAVSTDCLLFAAVTATELERYKSDRYDAYRSLYRVVQTNI